MGVKPHILRTKLQVPRVAPDILPRARLLDRLNEGRQRTLTLVSAPAGYGKSTLASRWVAACGSPSGWVSLDERDRDLRTFLSYVLAAIRSLFPKTELGTEVFLEASPLPSVSVLARHLLNDLHQITKPFILVLDDYYQIQDSPVNDLVMELLAHPPQAMHLVLLTRHDPALPISSMRGRGQATEIRAADLRFTAAEAAGFLNKMLKVPVDDATAGLLEKKTEGWVTGLRLAGLYLRDRNDLKQRVQELSGSSRHIAEYLFTEVLAKQNPEIAAYMVESSILDRFCAPLCQAAHAKGIERQNEKQGLDAKQFIDRLVEANIFVIPLDDQGYWFRYHHLFQDFLQESLRKQACPATIAGLHMQASKWFAENDLIDEALQHALAAGDTPAAVHLVLQHRYELLNTSQFARLSRWLSLLPADAVAENPFLLMVQVFLGVEWSLDADLFACMERARRKADALPAEYPDLSTLTGEIALMQSVQNVVLGQPSSASIHAQKALQLLPKHALFSRSMAVAVIAVTHQMEGDRSQGVKVLSDALAESEWPAGIRTRIWHHLGLLTFMDADSSGVLFAGHSCLENPGSTPFIQPRSNMQFSMGAVHYLRNELTEAKRHLTDVLMNCALAEAKYVVQACGILGFIRLAEGYPEEARHNLESVTANSSNMQDTFALATRDALLVEFALRQGEVDEARRLSVGVDFDLRPPHWLPYVPQLTRLKLLLAEGTDRSLREARTLLLELDERMARINRRNVRIDVLALLALVCHKLGEETAALEKLQAALDLAEPGGWIRNFVDLGTPMADLLERLNQTQPVHTYTQQVLKACRVEALGNPPTDRDAEKTLRISGQAAVPILSNRETEILHLLAEGLSNKEIASRIHVATETVKTHLQNIYGKLHTRGRIGALKKARALGVIATD
jgi:LuxR family maltose regulon positive regulatory protein